MTLHAGAGRLRLLDDRERPGLDPALLEVVRYRKSGLSVNWIIGCPLDCGYCVRHLFGNLTMKVMRSAAAYPGASTNTSLHRRGIRTAGAIGLTTPSPPDRRRVGPGGERLR